ncbi:MAG: chromosomal replication initiator protein DnaA [Clostridia bacterium]
MEESKKIWNALLSEIATRISTVSYEMWFSKIEPLTISYNKLVVVAPLRNYKAMLAKEYHNDILFALAQLNTYINDVIVITPDEKSDYDHVQPVKEIESDASMLFNSNYTFDTFVVGTSNQIAYAAAQAVAKDPGNLHNPLFIYGGVGLGKTHIMHAIGNYILHDNPRANICYVTTEQFVNDFVESIKNNKDSEQNRKFRDKYRKLDVFFLDDVQFLIGKTGTQEALFHTFNDLYQTGKQIVISSDRHPKELSFLEERLRSRFQCGLTCDVTHPDIETRIAILQKKAYSKKFNISQALIYFIAEKIDSNIRELEGALSKVIFYCQLYNIESADSIDIVKTALKDDIDVTSHALSIDTIVEATSEYFNIPKNEIVGKKKMKNIVFARQIAIYLTNDMLGLPLATIGRYFGYGDHTTIIYTRNKIAEMEKKDTLTAMQIRDIKNIVEKR